MKIRIHFTIPVALACMLLAQGARAQSSRIGPADIYPDPVRTPGAANPQVTQGNIKDNICNRQWSTKQIRPPAEYTSRLKGKQLREYGDTVHQARAQLVNPKTGKVDTTKCVAHSDNPACYEEDHLVSLENGGDPKDPRKLWPEPYNTSVGSVIMGAHQKDVVEGFIHDEICHDIPNRVNDKCGWADKNRIGGDNPALPSLLEKFLQPAIHLPFSSSFCATQTPPRLARGKVERTNAHVRAELADQDTEVRRLSS